MIVHAPRAATLAAALGAHREAAEHYRAALRWGHLLDDDRPRRPAGTAVLRVLPHGAAAGGDRRARGRARAAPRERRHAPHRVRPALAVAGVLVPAAQRRGRALRAGGRRDAGAAPGRHGARDGVQQHGPAADARRRHRGRAGVGRPGRRTGPRVRRPRHRGPRAEQRRHRADDRRRRAWRDHPAGEPRHRPRPRPAGTRRPGVHQPGRDARQAPPLRRWGRRCCRRASPSAPTGTSSRGRPTCAGPCSILLLETGRWAEARSLAHAVATQPVASVSRVNALMVLGRLGTRTGADPAAAAEAWEVAEPSGEAQRVLICASGMAEAAWTRDDLDDIRRRVDAVWDLAVERGGPWDVGELLWWLHCAGEHPRRAAARGRTVRPHAGGRRGARPRRRGTPSGARSGRRWPGRPPTIPPICGPPRSGFEALGATATHRGGRA